ncbi:DUF4263 domain-containing protein [Pseudomonas cichorii]|nr:Shedu anti-phage system protein SduA domain-containing protein [Pseudomonas cichorii]MBX8536257.1 DUF4263 domain-containing protein [Pseudomonas cichorii]
MLLEKFAKNTKDWWHSYFSMLCRAQKNNELLIGSDLLLYPTLLIVIKAPGFLAMELTGATQEYHGLSLKIHKAKSIQSYFNQFDFEDQESTIRFDASNNNLSRMAVSVKMQEEDLHIRFPNAKTYKTIVLGFNAKSAIAFGPNFISCSLNQVLLVNKSETLYRCKDILMSHIFKCQTTKEEVIRNFESHTKTGILQGVLTLPKDQFSLALAAQFKSMYLTPKLRETTIGEFLRLHPEIIKKALDCEEFLYEPSLPWLEGDETCEDKYINPDLLIKKKDGSWHIYDLKTALLDKQDLTTGERKRRGLISCVENGLSQLANYHEYFENPKNSAYAEEKFGIKIQNPRMVLIIGSWENVDTSKITQAMRKHKETIEIIDYDSFIHNFLFSLKPTMDDHNTTP